MVPRNRSLLASNHVRSLLTLRSLKNPKNEGEKPRNSAMDISLNSMHPAERKRNHCAQRGFSFLRSVPMTIRQLDLLIVVFDSAKARFFERGTDGRLHQMNEWQSGLHRH